MAEPEGCVSQLGEVSLVNRVAQGEEEAIACFYHTFADAVFRFVYRRVAERYEDAEEITQDVFLTAVSCASNFDGSCALLTWLCGIAKLRVADFYRRQGRRKRIPPDKILALEECCLELPGRSPAAASVEEVPERLDARRLVARMMASLKEDEREALMLRYVEEFSVREIAQVMKRSEKAIESLLMRAKRKAARAATDDRRPDPGQEPGARSQTFR